MADFKNYDPAKVVVSFRGALLVGFMDGTFVTAERTEDAYAMAVGASGDVARVRNRNRTGSITVTLMQTSPSNDALSAIAAADELSGLGYGQAIIKDLNGTTLVRAVNAWIRKLPAAEHSSDLVGRQWVLDCAELEMYLGGSVL